MTYPLIINCRDRLSPLRQLLAWLEGTAYAEDIILLDNASTYEPLLEYYGHTPHQVVHLGHNGGFMAPWEDHPVLAAARNQFFVVTDPDVVPVPECPPDAVDHFFTLLMRYGDRDKVGFSLKIDDLPDHYHHKAQVIDWEAQFHVKRLPRGEGYYGAIDTTFALYRPQGQRKIDHGARTDAPYEARHLSWYINSADPGPEELYYRQHAETLTHWSRHERWPP